VLLSVTFVAIAVLVDASWALAAARARPLLARRGRLRNRIAGGMLIGAGAALAAARHR
jgi:threonine/homoserine/homoserine lactone efflux protein